MHNNSPKDFKIHIDGKENFLVHKKLSPIKAIFKKQPWHRMILAEIFSCAVKQSKLIYVTL